MYLHASANLQQHHIAQIFAACAVLPTDINDEIQTIFSTPCWAVGCILLVTLVYCSVDYHDNCITLYLYERLAAAIIIKILIVL